MLKSTLFTLSLFTASAITDQFFSSVELTPFTEDPSLVDAGYTNLFDTDFTATIYGIPKDTGGGQKDLKKFGRSFLRKFNNIQDKIAVKTAANPDEVEEPGIVMFDTEVTKQYVGFSETDGDFNMLYVQSSLVCTDQSCPALSDNRRVLHSRHLVSLANRIKSQLINSGREYWKGVTCVRVSSEHTTFVDESDDCVAYSMPVVGSNGV